MNNAAKFVLVLPAVKPGELGPSGYAVWAEDYRSNEIVKDGDVVEAVGNVYVEMRGRYDDRYEMAYRRVRTASGFVGTVCWQDFNGREGFKPAG